MSESKKKKKKVLFSIAGTGLKRANFSYAFTIFLVLLVHMIYSLLFVAYDCMPFACYNAIIVLYYFWCLHLIKKKRLRLVVVMTHLEIMLYLGLSIWYFGWGYGFAVYLIALVSMTYFNPFSQERVIFMFSLVEAVLFLILWGYTLGNAPRVVLDEDASIIFSYVNYCSCFIGIITASGLSQLSIHSLTTANSQIIYNQTTKAFSREYFHQTFRELLDDNKEKKYTLCCVRVIDFPLYRELFGQDQAELVLKKIADFLKNEKNGFSLVGHVSSDIFGIVLERAQHSDERMERGLSFLAGQFSNERYQMHIAAGVYDIDDPSEPTSIHVERARMALNVAKEDYTRSVVHFDNVLLQKSKMSINIVSEFEKALEKGEFVMYLQPQIDRAGKLSGAETLVRWMHPKKGLISPSIFVPALEDAGLICRMDAFIWEEAAKRLKHWKEIGKDEYSLSINISVRDFYHLDLYSYFTGLVERYKIEPEKLKLEITESVLMRDPQSKVVVIDRLKEAGFVVEIDDFGSGYSSLNMMKNIHADVIKLDMEFLRDTQPGDSGRTIVRWVIDLAKELGIHTIVEGVETKEQVDDLLEMGCDVFQGMYFSGPITVEELEQKFFS